MDYDEIEQLRARHAAWALLSSRNAALVLSFLGRVFVDANAGNLPLTTLVNALDDELYALNQRLVGDDGSARFPRPAKEYLDEWSSPEKGWLRRFYAAESDEPHYDLTPAVEKALAWVSDLRARTFIGTESRLTTIFELLRQIVYGADDDPSTRLAELHRRRADIDAEIDHLESGEVTLADPVTQRDRYQQFGRTARELLADFRQVEENFRDLDRALREQVAGWEGSKGELLDDLFTNRSGITESDQGRSFRAFYDLLLSSERQAELSDLLAPRRRDRRHPRSRSGPRTCPLRLDRRERADAGDRPAALRAASPFPRRSGVDGEPAGLRPHAAIEAKALRLRDQPDPPITTELDDVDVRGSCCRWSGRSTAHPNGRGSTPVRSRRASETSTRRRCSTSSTSTEMPLLHAVLEQLGLRDSVRARRRDRSHAARARSRRAVGYLSLREPGLRVDFDDEARTRVAWEPLTTRPKMRTSSSSVSRTSRSSPSAGDRVTDEHEQRRCRRDRRGPTTSPSSLVQLFKGPLYRDSHETLWESLLEQRRRVADYVAVLGLQLEVDDSEGYAFLRSLPDGESEVETPRLVARHRVVVTT